MDHIPKTKHRQQPVTPVLKAIIVLKVKSYNALQAHTPHKARQAACHALLEPLQMQVLRHVFHARKGVIPVKQVHQIV